jgi:hypothetical protein
VIKKEKTSVKKKTPVPKNQPIDFRLKENRQLGFDRFYRFHCETRDCSPDLFVKSWVADQFEFDFEKRCTLAFFEGATEGGTTVMVLTDKFPVLTSDLKPVINYYRKHKNKLLFSKDCRYRRIVFEEFLLSVGKSLKPYGSLGAFVKSCLTSFDPKINYTNLRNKCLSEWYHWGRLGNWNFCEALLRFIEAPLEPPTMEFAKGPSHRSGWAFSIGRDDLTGKRISKADCEMLEDKAREYIYACDFPNAGFFTLETASCNYKRQFKGSRYGGCYIDEHYDRLIQGKNEWAEYKAIWDKCLEGRYEQLPRSLLVEANNPNTDRAYRKDWVKSLRDFGQMPRVEAWYSKEPQRWVSLKEMPFYK